MPLLRIKEVNAAREKIGEEKFLETDEYIKTAYKYGLCKELVLNDPNFEDKLLESIEEETKRLTDLLNEEKEKRRQEEQADKIREEITLFSGKTITENLEFATQSKIKGYFREKGYYSVGVDIQKSIDTMMNNSEIFIINIDKGSKVKIGELNFIGNESVKDWKLAAAMNVYGAPSAPTPAHWVTKLAVAHCGAALAAVGAPTTTVPASAVTASTETIRDLSEIFIIRVPSQALLGACMLKEQQGPCLNRLCRRCTYHHQVSMHQ